MIRNLLLGTVLFSGLTLTAQSQGDRALSLGASLPVHFDVWNETVAGYGAQISHSWWLKDQLVLDFAISLSQVGSKELPLSEYDPNDPGYQVILKYERTSLFLSGQLGVKGYLTEGTSVIPFVGFSVGGGMHQQVLITHTKTYDNNIKYIDGSGTTTRNRYLPMIYPRLGAEIPLGSGTDALSVSAGYQMWIPLKKNGFAAFYDDGGNFLSIELTYRFSTY